MKVTRSNPPAVATPVGAYSQAVRVEVGEAAWIYVSGQLALDEHGALVGSDLPTQTAQVFENLRRILEHHGATFDHVVKIQIFATTTEGFAEAREVRARFLPADPPASTAIVVRALVLPEALIEVDLVAVVPADGASG